MFLNEMGRVLLTRGGGIDIAGNDGRRGNRRRDLGSGGAEIHGEELEEAASLSDQGQRGDAELCQRKSVVHHSNYFNDNRPVHTVEWFVGWI